MAARIRRARRRMGLAGLLAGAGAAGLLLPQPGGQAWALVILLAGALLRGSLPRPWRMLAGYGAFAGWALAGAGLAVAALGRPVGGWGCVAFGTGLLALGVWIARGAGPPRDDAPPTVGSLPASRRNAP